MAFSALTLTSAQFAASAQQDTKATVESVRSDKISANHGHAITDFSVCRRQTRRSTPAKLVHQDSGAKMDSGAKTSMNV